MSWNLSNKQNLQTPNLITLFEENNKVIRSKFVGYHYSTKVKKTKIRFQRYLAEQNILTSDTGERLPNNKKLTHSKIKKTWNLDIPPITGFPTCWILDIQKKSE